MKPIEGYVLENYVSPSIFVQAALAEFCATGRFEPNLERIREGLRIRRDAMLAALEREAPEGMRWNEPEGGYFLWLDLPAGVDASELLARGDEAGVTFVKGSDFFLDGGGDDAARLAFSFATAEEIDEGIGRLAGLVREAAGVPRLVLLLPAAGASLAGGAARALGQLADGARAPARAKATDARNA